MEEYPNLLIDEYAQGSRAFFIDEESIDKNFHLGAFS
jgi:hypothetical protein